MRSYFVCTYKVFIVRCVQTHTWWISDDGIVVINRINSHRDGGCSSACRISVVNSNNLRK